MTGDVSPAKLIWIVEGEEETLTLDQSELTIGRSPDNQLVLSGSAISRHHARVFADRYGYFIEDLASSCGTYLNGRRLESTAPHELKSGDLIRLGKLQIQFVHEHQIEKSILILREAFDASISQQRLKEEIRHFKETVFECLDDDRRKRPQVDQLKSIFDERLAQLSRYFEMKLREYRILQEITQIIGKILDIKEMLSTALELASTVLHADRGFILLYDPVSKRLHSTANRLFDPQEPTQATPNDLTFSHTVASECFARREIILIHDAMREQRFKGSDSIMMSSIRSVVCIPLLQSEEIAGVMYLDNLRQPGRFHDHQLEFLETLSSQISIALENARLYTNAVTDDLTGLYNRKFIEKRAQEELLRAQRHERKCSLIVADLDHFKQINDRYGHLKGDEVLMQVARSLQKTSRISDIVARYGGEEFLILLPETNREGAIGIANRIRESIEELNIKAEGHQIKVTTSLGVATYHHGYGQELSNFIKDADRALYQAKASGRNRIEFFEAEPHDGDSTG